MNNKPWLDAVMRRPTRVFVAVAAVTLLAVLQYPRIKVDTDPENMLPQKTPVRVFHHEVKKTFGLHDFIVVGVVRDQDPSGVFVPEVLKRVYDLTNYIKGLEGVIGREVISLNTKDNILQGQPGEIRFQWLMEHPPQTRAEARTLLAEALEHPFFKGGLVSEDGQAVAIIVPLKTKDVSYEVAQKIRSYLSSRKGDEQYFITGLPVAEDQFGVEMFKQMAISAPLAGLVIFLLMWWFFKKAVLIAAPMGLAVITVLVTMGALIGFGFPVHIMSSMIPVFLMPIAVLDSVHILSEFFDSYPQYKDRRKTLHHVYSELFSPMLFTSLTSAAGFFSLSFSPIPPVQVFGVFVALGIALAWVLTMVLIPAYVAVLPQRVFENFGYTQETHKKNLMDLFLQALKRLSMGWPRVVLLLCLAAVALALVGIGRIQVNDNPVRWFSRTHPIRISDETLNHHLAGTYEAYLILDATHKGASEPFKDPTLLQYVDRMTAWLHETLPVVGKTLTLSDLVKKIYYELVSGDPADARIPPSKAAVAQTLLSFENSHKPDDLWHLVTPDFQRLNVWFLLTSGDNQDMARVVKAVEQYMKDNPPPIPLNARWAGLTYINLVWQNRMVVGMLKNFLGSFVIVLIMMLFLFRSPVRALLSMVPLSITILFIYGLLGYVGKDYDMPVAVLSALTLGLSIDFAIHFIQRAIEIYGGCGDWCKTMHIMSQGPARAITRNALIVAIGFLPLLAAPLIPYRTVGLFMFLIMLVSGFATLLILPALATWRPAWFFEVSEERITCRCRDCILINVIVVSAVAYVLMGYTAVPWRWSFLLSLSILTAAALGCRGLSQRTQCRPQKSLEESQQEQSS